MSANASNVKISPVDVTWEIEEQVCVNFDGVVAANMQDKYFRIYDATVTYNVVADVDAAGITSPGGGTDITVALTTGMTVTAAIAAYELAIEAATGYTGRLDGTRTFYTLDTTSAVATDAADVDTGFDVAIVTKGGSTYLGLLDGNVEPTFTQDLLDVTAHQFGTSILSQLQQGNNAEMTLALKESTNALYKEIFKAAGDTFTPVAGTELYGWGDSKQGANVIPNSRRLLLHPVKNVGDASEDLTFWLAYPNPDTITYSGEDFKLLNVTFTTFLDLGKPKAIRRFAFGDSSQAGITI